MDIVAAKASILTISTIDLKLKNTLRLRAHIKRVTCKPALKLRGQFHLLYLLWDKHDWKMWLKCLRCRHDIALTLNYCTYSHKKYAQKTRYCIVLSVSLIQHFALSVKICYLKQWTSEVLIRKGTYFHKAEAQLNTKKLLLLTQLFNTHTHAHPSVSYPVNFNMSL